MRKISTPNDYLPSAVRTEDGSCRRSQESEALPFQSLNTSPSTNWEEPWLAMGQAQPGWWQAFALDHGVRSTRTPDKFIRKPQDTNVFDLPTGELMRADRLAELAMNKPEDEIHKRIERLRAAIEAPPLKTFTQQAQSAGQPPSASAMEQPRATDVPRKAEPPRASAAHDVEIPVSEAVETVSQPVPEPPITSLPTPSTKFVPSAFQSALYRIDVSLKHALLTITDAVADEPEVPEAPLAATIGEACGSESREADVIGLDGHSEPDVFEGVAADLVETQSTDGAMAASQEPDQKPKVVDHRANRGMDGESDVATVTRDEDGTGEVIQVVEELNPARTDGQEQEVDLGYLALVGEDSAPIQTLLRVKSKVAPQSVTHAPAAEQAAVVEKRASIGTIA